MNALISCAPRDSSVGPSGDSVHCMAARGIHGIGLYTPIAMSNRTPGLLSKGIVSFHPSYTYLSSGSCQMYDHIVLSMFASALELSLLLPSI